MKYTFRFRITGTMLLFATLSLFVSVCETIAGDFIGQKLPEIKVINQKNQPVNINHYLGQPLLLFIWSTGCSSCEAEIKGLDDIYREFGPKNFVPIGIHLAGSASFLTELLKQPNLQVSYPMLLDEYMTVAMTLEILEIPTALLIDAEGVIRAWYQTTIPIAKIREQVAAWAR